MVSSLDLSLSPGKKLVPVSSSAAAKTSAMLANVGVAGFGGVGVFFMVFFPSTSQHRWLVEVNRWMRLQQGTHWLGRFLFLSVADVLGICKGFEVVLGLY